MKKYLRALAILFVLGLSVSSCDLNNDFEEVQVEDITDQKSNNSTGSSENSTGQTPPPGVS